ncbi:peptidase MA family metallohydrolase [Desemzia sp. FAM 23991]|uniref:peptidase MA family metallohydrolase n=1 Tax=unclassified Desemzia TaxID=2685243 RepID=UPI00388A7A09
MKLIKKSLFALVVLCLMIAAFFGILLFLDSEQGLAAVGVALLLAGAVIFFSVVGIFQPRWYPVKSRTSNSLAIIATLVFSVTTLILAGLNMGLYQVEEYITEGKTLSVQQKLTYYKQFTGTEAEETVNLEELSRQEIGTLTFYYEEGEEIQETIDQAVEVIQQNQTELQNFVGGEAQKPVGVVFYSATDQAFQTEDTGWGKDGFYSTDTHLIHLPLPLDKTVLIHEYTHHLIQTVKEEQQIFPLAIPVWLEEGTASYLAEKNHEILSEFISQTEYISFRELESQGGWESYQRDAYDPYFQSRGFVQYLVQKEGENIIQRMFRNISTSSSFDEALQQETGKNLEEYEEAFFNDFKLLPTLMKKADAQDIQERNSEKAAETLLTVMEIVPNMELDAHRLAQYYMLLGNYELAVEYREKNIQYQEASTGIPSSASYIYLAHSLLYTDIDGAVEAAERSVAYAEDGYSEEFNQQVLNELLFLQESIEYSNPYKGYLAILQGEYMRNSTITTREKRNLINMALEKYPHIESVEKEELIALKHQLE